MFDLGEGAFEGVVRETGQLKGTSEQVCVHRTTLTYRRLLCRRRSLHLQPNLVPRALDSPQSADNTYPACSALTSNPSKEEYTPSQSCNCLIHEDLAYSIGGSKKITWFCILISCMIGFSVMSLPELQPNHQSLLTTKEEEAYLLLHPLISLLLLATSLTGNNSLRVSLSSTLSNSAHHT